MVRFGVYEVDFGAREIRKAGVRLRIQDQQLKILESLVARPGELVTREELRDRVWPADTFVDFDKNLNVAVAKLRQVLNDSADQPRYIETVPRKGYRFVAPLIEIPPEPNPSTHAGHAELPVGRGSPLRLSPWWAIGLILIVGWLTFRASRPRVDDRLIQLDLQVGNPVSQPAVAPDGTVMTFVTDGHLAVRRLDADGVVQLLGTEGASSPFFSFDGKWIAYFAGRKLRRVSLDGREAAIICDAPSDRGGTWTADGRIIAGLGDSGALYVVNASGGTPQPFTIPQGGATALIQHRRPRSLPGSAGFLFVASTGIADGSIQAVGQMGGSARTVVTDASAAWYLPSGYLVFQRGTSLFAAAFDVGRLEISGQPWPILGGVSQDYFRGGDIDVSLSGTLVFRASPGHDRKKVVWLEREGGVSDKGLPLSGAFLNPRLSGDGKRLALVSEANGAMEIWALELGRLGLTRLTFGDVRSCPVWTPDGQYVVFSAGRSLSWTRWDRVGDLGAQNGPEGSVSVPWSFSPNGRWLAFHRNQPATGYDLWLASVSRAGGVFQVGDARPLLIRPGTQAAPAISPDGRWLAYASDESGRPEIYVVGFSESDGVAAQNRSWRVSTDGGRAPIWDFDGSRIFFRSLDDHVVVAGISSRSDQFAAQTPAPWSPVAVAGGSGLPNFDVAPNGRGVVAIVDLPEARPDRTHLRVLLNVEAKIRAEKRRKPN